MNVKYKEIRLENLNQFSYRQPIGAYLNWYPIERGYIKLITPKLELYFLDSLRHNSLGPASVFLSHEYDSVYFYHGEHYLSREKWFEALTKEEKSYAIWEFNE